MDGLENKYQRLLEEGTFSNVTFVVGMDEEERIKAHKNILSVSSSVFHSLLLEPEDEIRIPDISPSIFKALLKYFYVNECPELNEDNWAPFLYAAEKYEMNDLKEECIEFVKKNCTSKNAVGYFNQGKKFHVGNLVSNIKDTITSCAREFLTSDSFLEIECNEVLSAILSLDFDHCNEMLIFRSALKWASSKIKEREEEQNGATIRSILGPALYAIRFPRLRPNEFVSEVIPKDILTDEEILSILKKKYSCPFICDPRRNSKERFDEYVRRVISNKCHAIKFKVDGKVEICGMFLNRPWNKDKVIKGRVFIKDEQNAVLGEKDFTIQYHDVSFTCSAAFDDPICINSNNWYIACVEFASTPVETWTGINGHFKIKYEGVKLTFENDSLSEETNVFEGQIPGIIVRKIE